MSLRLTSDDNTLTNPAAESAATSADERSGPLRVDGLDCNVTFVLILLLSLSLSPSSSSCLYLRLCRRRAGRGFGVWLYLGSKRREGATRRCSFPLYGSWGYWGLCGAGVYAISYVLISAKFVTLQMQLNPLNPQTICKTTNKTKKIPNHIPIKGC